MADLTIEVEEWIVEVYPTSEIAEIDQPSIEIIELGTQGVSGAIALADHVAAIDPHPQYTTDAEVLALITASNGGGSGVFARRFELSFTQADLSIASILPVIHNLGLCPLGVIVWNSSGEEVTPDAIALLSFNTLSINLLSFAPISGTWKIALGA